MLTPFPTGLRRAAASLTAIGRIGAWFLSAAFAGEMQDEIFSGMMDEFLETRLAERMMRTVIRRGGVINVSDVEGVRSVLADAAENFSKMPGFVSEKKVAAEVAKLLQKECSWDVRSEPVRKTVAEFTDQFTQIVARNRADFYLYYRNQNAARQRLPILTT